MRLYNGGELRDRLFSVKIKFLAKDKCEFIHISPFLQTAVSGSFYFSVSFTCQFLMFDY